VATALTASLSLLLNLVAVAVFVVASGVDPRWTWLLLPIPLLLLMVVATGMAMFVSALYVPFRDVRPIWEVLLQALFYVTPVFWPIQLLTGKNLDLAHVAMGNPLAAIVQSARYLVVGPAAISPWEAIGGAAALAIPIALALAIAGIGFLVFDRMAPHVAERL
jgi:ABC-2 type transport system permease protein